MKEKRKGVREKGKNRGEKGRQEGTREVRMVERNKGYELKEE